VKIWLHNIKADFGAENTIAAVQSLKVLGEQIGLKGTELRTAGFA